MHKFIDRFDNIIWNLYDYYLITKIILFQVYLISHIRSQMNKKEKHKTKDPTKITCMMGPQISVALNHSTARKSNRNLNTSETTESNSQTEPQTTHKTLIQKSPPKYAIN